MGIRNFQPKHRAAKTGHRTINLERDKRQKLYRGNEEWREFSTRFLKENRECYCCGERSEAVDHLIPHSGDKDLFEKTGNHIPLCNRHHNTVTGKFDYKYRVGDPVEEKIKWLNNERSKNEVMSGRKFPSVKVINYGK